MGLDLVVEGCAKPGHESEWQRLVERYFSDEELGAAEIERFSEICIPAYQRIGAPRVGFDQAADEWILAERDAKTPEAIAAVLSEYHGYYVLELVQGDGVPKYSNGSSYDGIDATSFRGAFLKDCADLLGKELLKAAWNHKMPAEAVNYGRSLLAKADEAAKFGPLARRRNGILVRLGLRAAPRPVPLTEQLEILRTAGHWFIFWGERGHPIRAWF